MSKQGELTREIRAALIEHGPLSTTELSEYCLTALESRDISRAIGDLRRVNKIEVDPEIGSKTRDGRAAKRYRWVGQTVATHVEPVATIAPPLTTLPTIEDPMPHSPELIDPVTLKPDTIESYFVGLALHSDDVAMLYADSLLSEDPVWVKLRDLRSGCHNALHDHRLARALTDKVG